MHTQRYFHNQFKIWLDIKKVFTLKNSATGILLFCYITQSKCKPYIFLCSLSIALAIVLYAVQIFIELINCCSTLRIFYTLQKFCSVQVQAW